MVTPAGNNNCSPKISDQETRISAGCKEFRKSVADIWNEFVGVKARLESEGSSYFDIINRYILSNAPKIVDLSAGSNAINALSLLAQFQDKGGNPKVTALDGSPYMITAAKQFVQRVTDWEIFGCSNKPNLENLTLKCADWLQLENNSDLQPNSIDAMVNLGNSFTFLHARDERRTALENFYKLLKPGGVLIIDARNYPRLLQNGYSSNHSHNYLGEKIKVQDVKLKPEEQVFTFTYGETKNDEKSFDLNMYAITPQEFLPLAREVGFEAQEVYGDRKPMHFLAGCDYPLSWYARKEDTDFLTFVLQKPSNPSPTLSPVPIIEGRHRVPNFADNSLRLQIVNSDTKGRLWATISLQNPDTYSWVEHTFDIGPRNKDCDEESINLKVERVDPKTVYVFDHTRQQVSRFSIAENTWGIPSIQQKEWKINTTENKTEIHSGYSFSVFNDEAHFSVGEKTYRFKLDPNSTVAELQSDTTSIFSRSALSRGEKTIQLDDHTYLVYAGDSASIVDKNTQTTKPISNFGGYLTTLHTHPKEILFYGRCGNDQNEFTISSIFKDSVNDEWKIEPISNPHSNIGVIADDNQSRVFYLDKSKLKATKVGYINWELAVPWLLEKQPRGNWKATQLKIESNHLDGSYALVNGIFFPGKNSIIVGSMAYYSLNYNPQTGEANYTKFWQSPWKGYMPRFSNGFDKNSITIVEERRKNEKDPKGPIQYYNISLNYQGHQVHDWE